MSTSQMLSKILAIFWFVGFLSACNGTSNSATTIESEDRPKMLVSLLDDSPLKTQLDACDATEISSSNLSIGHRGAPLYYPEHTREGYLAAAEQGAGVIECDVTFTQDRELVCRHSQCDLHSTTNILDTELATRCRVQPDYSTSTPFKNVECCTSDITLAEFYTLKGKRDGGDVNATTVKDYLAGTPGWTSDSKANYGELLSHEDSITLFDSLGVSMTPELKMPLVPMPFEGEYTQSQYASQMLNEYFSAGIDTSRVFPQSFSLEDIEFWLQETPAFGRQAVYLDGRYRDPMFDINDKTSWKPTMDELAAKGVRYLASPIWMLLTLDSQQKVIPSEYARSANKAGLKLIAWTIERSGPITSGSNWYYQSIQAAVKNEGDVFNVIDVLTKDVQTVGIFSDWPATTSYYFHCMK